MRIVDVEVVRAQTLTPRMRRVRLAGPSLAGSADCGPDQQVRLFLPRGAQWQPVPSIVGADEIGWYHAYLAMSDEDRPWMRAFTVRRIDPVAGWLEVDVVLHDQPGPGSHWALQARPGQRLQLYGPDPSGSRRADDASPPQLLVGDHCALPAVAATLERLGPGERATVLLGVPPGEQIALPSRADVDLTWVGPDELLGALRAAVLPPRGTAWLAGEAGTVRAMRRHLLTERGFERAGVHFAGYWRASLTQDDPPTGADVDDSADDTEAVDGKAADGRLGAGGSA